MGIQIIKGPDIYITQSEYERLLPEYNSSQQYTTCPTTFETWLRERQNKKRQCNVMIAGIDE